MKCDTPMTYEEVKERLGIVDRKPKPMTNKEYYTETDEELAGFLSQTCRDLLASVVEDGGSVPNEYIEEDREFWLKWLKEKHTE